MLLDRLQRKEDFTPTEKIIADYVLAHADHIGEMSAAELGEATFTSKSAVLRLCQKLGAEGYRSFVHTVTVESMEQQHVEKLLEHEPFHAGSTPGEIMQELPDFYTGLVENTKLRLDKNMIQRVVNRLRHMEIIDIYGAGITQSIAQIGAYKFRSIGIESQAVESANERYIFRTEQRQHKAAVVISMTGSNEMMIRSAKVLKRTGYYVIGIGGCNSPKDRVREDSLRPYCDEYIQIYRNEMLMGTEMITMVNVYNYVIDILFVSLLTDNYEKNLAAALKVFHLYSEDGGPNSSGNADAFPK